MNRAQLEHAIRASGAISGDRELYVVGSQSILGRHPDAPAALLRSQEVDIAPKNFPALEEVIEGSIGELSPFHETFGFYVDGVDIDAIALPTGWQERLVIVDNPNTNGYRGLCIDPADLACAKLVARREKDLEFITDAAARMNNLVQDLLALTRALCQRADRLAWIGVLRMRRKVDVVFFQKKRAPRWPVMRLRAGGARVVYVRSVQASAIFEALAAEHITGMLVVPQVMAVFSRGIEREVDRHTVGVAVGDTDEVEQARVDV